MHSRVCAGAHTHTHAHAHRHLWNPRQPQAAHRSDGWRSQGCRGYWGNGAVSMDSSLKHEPMLTSASLTKAEPSWAVRGFCVSVKYVTRANASRWESGHVLSVAPADRAQGSRGGSSHPQTTEPWGPRWKHHVFPHLLVETCPNRCCGERGGRCQGKDEPERRWGFYWFIWYSNSNNDSSFSRFMPQIHKPLWQ